jgi:hypothetical protein
MATENIQREIKENVRFFLQVFPWQSQFPDHKEKKPTEGESVYIDDGILSMQIHRSKDNPYGTAVLNLYSKIHPAIFAGNWCLIKSYNGVQETAEDGIVRFFGQIYSVSTSYQLNAGGGLRQDTVVNIREWSFLYSVPVRYDSYAMLNLSTDDHLKFVKSANDLISKGNPQSLENLAKAVLDPFQFCALTLQWIGALSGKGLEEITKGSTYKNNFSGVELKDLQLPDVALLLPTIPRKLLMALDPNMSEESLDNPFSGDLVIQQFGVQGEDNNPYFNPDLGVFEDVLGVNNGTQRADKRPLYANVMSVFVNGQSAWDILNQGCDKNVNEIFTDLVYYKSDNGEQIIARPFLCFRDKPFMLDKYKEALKGGANWSSYDYVPRIDVPIETIERIDLSSSFTESANYIRVQYVADGILANEMNRVIADINGTVRLASEMLRYGGQTEYVQTPYTSTDGGYLPNWYKDIATLTSYWNGLLYRMPSVQLIIRDTNICFTVGFNVRFKVKENVFVGHLKNYSITYSRNTEGTHRTTTVLNLERVVMEDANGKLTFMPAAFINDIYSNVKAPEEDVTLDLGAPFKAMEEQEAKDLEAEYQREAWANYTV